MRTAYKIILVNVSTLLGCILVALTLPPGTAAIPFFVICGVTFAVVNVALIVWPKYRARRALEESGSNRTTAKVILIWLLFLLTVFINWRLRR